MERDQRLRRSGSAPEKAVVRGAGRAGDGGREGLLRTTAANKILGIAWPE